MKNLLLFVGISILLFSCGGSDSSSSRAEELCDCVTKEIDLKGINSGNIEQRMQELDKDTYKQQTMARCFYGVMENIAKDLRTLNKEEKKKYSKELLKSWVDCECMDAAFENIPYDMLETSLPSLKSEIDNAFNPSPPEDEYDYEMDDEEYGYGDYEEFDDSDDF